MNIAKAGRLIDRAEQLIALTLYVFLVQRIWPSNISLNSLAPAFILLSEGVVVLFLLIRRPTQDISIRLQDWIAATVGTAAPLLIVKSPAPANLEVGVFLILFGMIAQFSAKLSLWRSFGIVAANRGVRTGGAYRYVRHPMYFGYMVSHVGFLLTSPTLWNAAVYTVCWCCLLMRINFEERILSRDEQYQAFKRRTPHRLLPGVY